MALTTTTEALEVDITVALPDPLDAIVTEVPRRNDLHLFVTIALPQAAAYAYGPIGRLLTPRHYWRIEDTILSGVPWAMDNDAFSNFDEDRFLRMLEVAQEATEAAGRFTGNLCKFVTAPDVVGDAAATLALFDEWEPVIRAAGLPVALVAQDGLEELEVPWHRIDALFLGGSTEWKLSDHARRLTAEAKARGLWVHMGRVNSIRRLNIASDFGVDSVDGSKWARFRKTYMPDGVDHLRRLREEARP